MSAWWEEALSDCAARTMEWAALRDRVVREVYAQGISLRQVAKVCGLSHETVRVIAQGTERPRIARWRSAERKRLDIPTEAELTAELAALIAEQARDDRTLQVKWTPEPWEQRRYREYE